MSDPEQGGVVDADPRVESTNRRPGGRGAGLERDDIIRAAVRLIDEHGVEALTMRALGRELGVRAQALYWHFDDRDALCATIVDQLAALLEMPERGDRSARDQLHDHFSAIREYWLRHPAAMALNRRYVPQTMGAVSEEGMGLIQELGASRPEAFEMYRALSWALVGYVRMEAGLGASKHHTAADDTNRRYVVSLPLPADIDASTAILDTGATFELMLTLLLDGVETAILNAEQND